MADDAARDPDFEWLDYVPPQGVVAAPAVLRDLGLVPERQTAVETGEVRALLDAPFDAWAFVERVLGWDARFVAGAPGGPDLPPGLEVVLPEQADRLVPTWAVMELGEGGDWQMLVRVEAPRVAPDARHSLEGWEATPHQRLERLLRETGVRAGLLITQREAAAGELEPEIRLVYAPKGETSGWQVFPVRPMSTVAGRPILGGLKLLLDRSRLFADRTDRRLPAILHASRLAQDTVSEKLSSQVLGALFELLRGLDAAEPDLVRPLAAEAPGHLYEGLLAVLMRLVFILYAEDRDLLPSRRDEEARRIYDAGYSLRCLHARLTEDAALNPDTMDERRGGWGRLLALFRLIHAGHPSGFVQARRGGLFDPERYPFLEGRAGPAAAARVLGLSDGCLLRILDGLLVLREKGRPPERLSYRTLDVEQIGSVYETVMGFEARLSAGRALAVKGAKSLPFFVDLDALAAKKGKERLKQLKEDTGLSLSGARAAAVEAAADVEALTQALAPAVDPRGSPGAVPFAPGTPVLQPTDERRRSGSHYTPRSLTQPIVEHALAPAFERLGPDATAEQILDLKVCDPAMGSGAFLVEACRAIATRLAKAWERWPETKPAIPADELDDETLHARRLVAQRCLYGVDRNPRAVELGKLSLWLATLARDHEFTFLDHALKCGDSLVGLDLDQITAVDWDRGKAPTFFGKIVRDHLSEAEAERDRVRALAEGAGEAELRPMLRRAEAKLEVARRVGDGVIAAFFAESKPKARNRRLLEFQQDILAAGDWAERAKTFSQGLREGEHPIPPFHWPVEFPEVFSRDNPGFDAIVGNPPFAGKNTIIDGNRTNYLPWLQTLHEGAHGNADLVAHFFLRAFELLRHGGAFGLIATNTIGQGDTRTTGLSKILASGGAILRATRRLKWPGEAAVVVSVVNLCKGSAPAPALDGRQVSRISAYLVEGDLDVSPAPLAANSGKAFQGSIVLGMGFTFDDAAAAKGEAESLARMREVIEKDPRNAERIFPFLGGEEVNTSPTHAPSRYVIDFADYPLRRDPALTAWASMSAKQRELASRSNIVPTDYPYPVAADWPDLLEIVERRVKPERDKVDRQARRERWWRFGDRQPGLYAAIGPLEHVLVTGAAAVMHHMFARVSPKSVFSHKTIVLTVAAESQFTALQSRIHEIWSRQFGTTFGSVDALTYNPTQVFRTFPFPEGIESDPILGAVGGAYLNHRTAMMIDHEEGLTKTYNRFHACDETSLGIVELRRLHAEMDRAVLSAYGWTDLAERATPEFQPRDDDPEKTRLDWPQAYKDEVLARLLDLNRIRAAEERALGLTTASEDDADADDSNADED
ncbi:MAG TPA: DNA methyltransferase [Caulobacteraceae bacterium]|nr:DNA methyltransferase [Caulobacteraceae bacterium]